MTIDFKDRQVVISAGCSGIGYALAKAYEAEGAQVYVCDVDPQRVEAVNSEHERIHAFQADVSKHQEVDAFFDFIRSKTPHLDILINNAGIAGPTKKVEDILPEEWDQCVAVDLNGIFYVARQAFPMIRKAGGGSVINTSSSAAFFGFPFRSPYTAAKWAVIGLSKTWAMEYGADNIRVNAICPGSVKGDRIDRVVQAEADLRGLAFEEVKAGYERQVSLRTFVDVEDIINTCFYLSSDLGKNISGQMLGVDGHTETLTNY